MPLGDDGLEALSLEVFDARRLDGFDRVFLVEPEERVADELRPSLEAAERLPSDRSVGGNIGAQHGQQRDGVTAALALEHALRVLLLEGAQLRALLASI